MKLLYLLLRKNLIKKLKAKDWSNKYIDEILSALDLPLTKFGVPKMENPPPRPPMPQRPNTNIYVDAKLNEEK